MALTQQDCERILDSMSPDLQSTFLSRLGHLLTVVGRKAYEFQGPGVTDPRLLLDLNEIHHRLYTQIEGILAEGKLVFTSDILAAWLTAEGKSEILQQACFLAFERCLQNGPHSL